MTLSPADYLARTRVHDRQPHLEGRFPDRQQYLSGRDLYDWDYQSGL